MRELRKTRGELNQLYKVELCTRMEIKDFIETNHYSKSINGVLSSFCYKVIGEEGIVAAAIFGKPAMAGQWKKYVNNPNDLLELRRFVAIDNTPRNFESFVLSKMLKDLKKHVKAIVSYADPRAGHKGIIYKALGFSFEGQVPNQRKIVHQGKEYHDKTIRTMYKGKPKPYAQRLIDALNRSEAYYITVEGKYRYIKYL